MNFAKGKRTKGRGSSFQGALLYYLHDKDALTSQRVGFVECLNIFTQERDQIWRELMDTALSADLLKAQAGIKATGRKNTKPVYCFALAWHPDEDPRPEHMLATAKDALRVLGLFEHQAVIVQHTDEPHQHVHILVNTIHPQTGRSADLYNDEKTLDKWAHDYELAHGIRSHDRAAKHQARAEKREPPPRKRTPSTDEHEAREAVRPTLRAKVAAEAIVEGIRYYTAMLMGRQKAAELARQDEMKTLAGNWRVKRDELAAVFQDMIEEVLHPPALSPDQHQEWRELNNSLAIEAQAFADRESSLLGIFRNAIHANRLRQGTLTGFFNMMITRKARWRAFREERRRRLAAFRRRQQAARRAAAARLREELRVALLALDKRYQRDRTELRRRHADEVAANKQAWTALKRERARAWSQFRILYGDDREKAKDTSTKGALDVQPPRTTGVKRPKWRWQRRA